MPATEYFEAKMVGFPVFFLVGENRKAGNWPVVAVIEPVVVGEHPPGKVAVALTLDFNVNVDPTLLTLVEGDWCQRIGKAFAQLGLRFVCFPVLSKPVEFFYQFCLLENMGTPLI